MTPKLRASLHSRVTPTEPAFQAHLADELDGPLDTFELIQIGKWHSDGPNHSLAEFADA